MYVHDAQSKAPGQIRQQLSQHGQAVSLPNGYLTKARFCPVHLAAVHPPGAREPWFIVSVNPVAHRPSTNTLDGSRSSEASSISKVVAFSSKTLNNRKNVWRELPLFSETANSPVRHCRIT